MSTPMDVEPEGFHLDKTFMGTDLGLGRSRFNRTSPGTARFRGKSCSSLLDTSFASRSRSLKCLSSESGSEFNIKSLPSSPAAVASPARGKKAESRVERIPEAKAEDPKPAERREDPMMQKHMMMQQQHSWGMNANTPHALCGWVNLLVNVLVAAAFLYLIYLVYATVQNDIYNKIQLFSDEVVEQIGRCSRDYQENRCDPAVRVPAMEQACRAWEQCMNRDPYVVARRAKFSGETLGEAMNGFFEKLTWKTISCIGLLFFSFLVFYNLVFHFTRQRKPDNLGQPGPPGPPMHYPPAWSYDHHYPHYSRMHAAIGS